MGLWARIKSWFRDRLRARFGTEYVEEDAPEHPRARTLYVVTEDGEPWSAAMLCPCGCGATLHMNLRPDERPVWSLTVNADGTGTLHPSINRMKGCLAHFWFRDGRVYWCAEQRDTLLKDVRLLLGLKRAA
jgi:hypothetical protein